MDNKREESRERLTVTRRGGLVLDSALISPRPTRVSDPSVSALEGVAESLGLALSTLYFIIHRRSYIVHRGLRLHNQHASFPHRLRHRRLLIRAMQLATALSRQIAETSPYYFVSKRILFTEFR